MAALSRAVVAVALAAGCSDKLAGLQEAPEPLARIRVAVAGDLPDPASVALVWGAEWIPEPLCVLPPESPAAAEVIARGCPDTFGFVPARVVAAAPVVDGAATLDLFSLPEPDLMVGDVTARVAYASVVLFEDRNLSGTLELRRAISSGAAPDDAMTRDAILGASFVRMTEPDERIAFREGAFNALAAFYPRAGCAPPPPGFSVLGAGGFSASAAIAAALEGKLPQEDASSCAAQRVDEATVTVAVRPGDDAEQVACQRRRGSGFTRFRPPPDLPDIDRRAWACVGLPDLDGHVPEGAPQQLIIAGSGSDPCPLVRHYTLRGCDNDPVCADPEWDLTATPPPWWPCP